MIIQAFTTTFREDLQRLRQEIEAYRTERSLWTVVPGISNAAGNLCLHLVGNLITYIGNALGNTSYKRQRHLEFSLKDIPRKELLKMIGDTMVVVETTLEGIKDEVMAAEYPMANGDKPSTVAYMLIHLAAHLNYHLGQINYHRRLLDI